MPHTITFEREKLNQAMYQKLKKFIMNKRKREAEERAQADYYRRLKREREERRRQLLFSAESLENAKREIYETRKRILDLRTEREKLHSRLKQLSSECKFREAEIRSRSQQVQIEKASMYSDQYQNRASQEALLMLSKAPHKCMNSTLDAMNLRKQVGQLYCPSLFNSPTSTSHGAHDTSNTSGFPGLSKRPLDTYSSHMPQHQQVASKGAQDLSNREFTQQEIHALTKYLVEFSSGAGGKLQSDVLNSINTGPLAALINTPKFASLFAGYRAAPPPQGCQTAPTSGVNSSSGGSSSVSGGSGGGGGSLLPPAPTGYRGSITTGQSAQQIQLAQQLAAQQHVAALYGGTAGGVSGCDGGSQMFLSSRTSPKKRDFKWTSFSQRSVSMEIPEERVNEGKFCNSTRSFGVESTFAYRKQSLFIV